ncbi:MAG: T9SS C-terminal target domain-containing protein [Calditrichaeota bacterium]|nr:MAG: T9SS C-terminal target domain-containing protein [Calditrichota bacterium]MBL1206465.1 T9SS C-terminal target domain-containing protein [Calditrichota bacterium]NOG46292.1 T9SS type A sorting domain-containing protein [Calditrichota bacterium]
MAEINFTKNLKLFYLVLIHFLFINFTVAQDLATEPASGTSTESITITYPKQTGAVQKTEASVDSLPRTDAQGSFSASAGGSDYYITASWSGYSNPCVIPSSSSGNISWSPGWAGDPISGNANNGSKTVYPGPNRRVDFTYKYTYSGTLCDGSYSSDANATTAALKNPTSFSASDATSDYWVDLSWGKGTNIPASYVTYYIYRNGSFFASTTSLSYRAYITPGQSDTWNVRTHSTFSYSVTSGGVSNGGSTSSFRVPYSQTASYEDFIGEIVLNWNSNSDYATHFRIYRDGALIATVPRATLTYTDENIINGEEYTYTIKGYNASAGVESGGVSVNGKTFPMFPNAADGIYNNRVKVSWKNVASFAEEIKILRGDEEIGITSKNATSYFDYDAVPGKLYQYSIVPISGGAELGAARDYGFIRPDGKISGKVKTVRGAGVKNVQVSINPANGDSSQSLLFDNTQDYMIRKPIKSFAESAFTLSFWMKSNATSQTGAIFSYATPASDNTVLIYNPNNFEFFINGAGTGTTNISAVDNAWHHIAVTWQKSDGAIRLLKDGIQVWSGTLATGATLQNNGSIVLGQDQDSFGGGFDPVQAYLGQLDEIQLWDHVVSDSIINSQINLTLRGDEDGLVSYWPFDSEGRQPLNIAGDFSKAGGNHVQGYGVSFSTDHAPVETIVLTDPTGFYSVNNIFYNESNPFDISVFKLRHGFDPTSQERTLELNAPASANVDFTDTTSFAISGKIVLNGTNCAVAGVDIYRNGTFTGIKTNAQGEYLLSIEEPGNYTITPVFGDTSFPHVFEPAELVFTITDDVANADFTDMTTSELAGRVGGGCDAFIGRANISITSKNQVGCYSKEITTDVNGNYSLNLPSQEYIVEVLSLDPPNPVITETFPIVITDLTFQDTTLNYIYRNPPQIKVSGFPGVCADASAPFNVPIINQYDVYTFQIEVFEEYSGDTCLVDTGSIKIFDDLGGNPAVPVTLPLKDGRAFYTTQIGEPNILDGGAHPFQKLFQVTADVEGKNAAFEQWVVVTGHKPREQTFVTKTPELPLLILRDPPGDESYAYLEKGSSLSQNFTMSHSVGGAAGLYTDIKIGAGIPVPFTGIVIGARTHIEGQILAGRDNNNGTTVSTTFSQTERFSTSGNEDITGEKGDVFMGASFNMIYALTDEIRYDEASCTVIQDTSLVWGSEEVNTTYIYTENHIRKTLLPNLHLLRSLASPDSVALLGSFIDVWEQVLEKNDQQKERATFERNISFSAGTTREYSETNTQDSTISIDFTIFIDSELKIGVGIGDGDFADVEIGAAAKFRWSTSEARDTTLSQSTTVGYVLGDNDPGDFFSVDIKKDNVYSTPVFDLVAGTSSCPWEPGTQPRDATNLTIDKFEQNDIPPFDPASFVLNLGNLSQSGETRDYKLGVIQSSNFDGAVISVGGVVIEDFIDYRIPAGQQITATMAVRRGPVSYSYENLQLRFYALCDPSISDTVTFSVNYQSPCSGVELFKPDNNWLVNQSSNDSLLIIMREYDTTNPKLESVSMEYRKVGGSWKTAIAKLRSELPAEFIYEFWDVSGLDDGNYELRAKTKCGTDGVNYSKISQGVIDRSSLLVFGKPQPSDGVLNIGEDISISFTANLNCPQINSDNVKMINTATSIDIPIDVACSGKTLIITPLVDIATLERENLKVTVSGVEDKNGNGLKEDISWSFTVNQNALHWVVSNANINVYKGSQETFKAKLVNVGGAQNSFSLTGIPSWLTADPTNGTIPSGGQIEINFTISDQLEQGSYLDTVAVQVSGQGDDPLFIDVTVLSEPPSWAFNFSNYQYSMDVIAQLKEGDGFSSDEKDIVAAFVGNEIRGKVNLTHVSEQDNHLAFITIYSHQQSGETVTFRSWDASKGEESGFIAETITFENNGSVGLLLSPFVLTPSGKAQNITLAPNWNWFSLNLEQSDMSVENILSNLNATSGDVIKGQEGIATFYNNELSSESDKTNWIGDLQNIEVGKSYRIFLANEQNLRFAGDTINVSEESIQVFSGWNWIGYLQQNNVDLNNAFTGFSYSDGDRLKSQDAFSVYDASSSSWQGGLTTLNPGEGYLLKSAKDGFISFSGSGSSIINPGKNIQPNQQPNLAGNELSAYNYENNMTIIGSVQLGGTTISDSNYSVLAIVNDSLRGKADVKFYPEINKAMVFMTVYSNSISGEELTFEVINSSHGVSLPVTTTIPFTADGIVGSIENPHSFAGIDEVAPEIRSAFLYSTEPGLADHVRLYITSSELLKEAPLVRAVSPTGKEDAFAAEVFDSGENIYLAKYHVQEYGENTFYILASDLSENLTQDVRKLSVNQISLGKSSLISLNENTSIKLSPASFNANGNFYGEYYKAEKEELEKNMMRISQNMTFSASSTVDEGFTVKYDLKEIDIPEEEKRKIGLYRLDKENGEWVFIGGQGENNQLMQLANQTGTFAVFYDSDRIPIPKQFRLYQNFPNPFNPVTTIRFDLPKEQNVSLNIYNVLGQKVKQLLNQKLDAGYHKTEWNGLNEHGVKVASGIYIYQIKAGKKLINKKMILIK